ncbi:YIP1 family protein [Hyalangium gracile]|uniref:YIP1 family protein n=1 Tax=Hyalangium gracile TaxID=394092 RepID=UPI001CCB42A0|nr:Yip1 family protein [Hyalangium gracile]
MEGSLQATCAVHPERQALQICARCGTFACEQCLGDSAAGEPLCSACVERDALHRLPWDNRKELGIFRAWFKSVGPIMLRPGMTFASTRTQGDLGGAFLFAGIANFFGYFTTFLLFTIFVGVMPTPDTAVQTPVPFKAMMVGTYGTFTVLAPLFGMAMAVFIAALDHVVLRMIGKPRSFETTVRAAAFAQAPLVLGLLPFCGLYVAPFWCLVAKVHAYKGMHRLTAGKAAAGALLVPVLGTVVSCGAYLAIVFVIVSAIQPGK